MPSRRSRELAPIAPKLARLTVLASDGPALREYVRELIESETDFRVLYAALDAVAPILEPGLVGAVTGRYWQLDARSDSGGLLRARLAASLTHVKGPGPVPLFKRAVSTYERTFESCTGDLRAAGLLGLYAGEPDLALFHAVRFMHDADWMEPLGQPALAAVRVLEAAGQDAAIYAAALTMDHPDVLAECVRCLTRLTSELLPPVIARIERLNTEYSAEPLLALIDLAMVARDSEAFVPFITRQLEESELDVFRYLAAVIVSSRKEAFLERLRARSDAEDRSAYQTVIQDALVLLR